MRSTYIFGNGLGMAVSPEAFNLTDAMISVWSSGILEPDQKELIAGCLPKKVRIPTSEEQLAKLQETLNACEILLSVHDHAATHWLTDHGRNFPEAIYRLNFAVSRRMHTAAHTSGEKIGARFVLPEDFMNPMISKIRDTNSHVATLNYDCLLSASLRKGNLLDGKKPVLFDGFVSGNFERRNLFRKGGLGGWYLHLHGSPLFVGKSGQKIRRLSERALTSTSIPASAGTHLVLTHFEHKSRVIAASDILRDYWEFLLIALKESEKIVIFGYSGNDLHLNQLVSQNRAEKKVTVVEWLGSGAEEVRQPFWSRQLGGAVKLHLLEDIFTFTDW